jgi:hypothetical protein
LQKRCGSVRYLCFKKESIMHVPTQSKSIQRTITGQPWGNRSGNGTASNSAHGQGVSPSGHGVNASGFNFGNLLQQLPGLVNAFSSFF